MDEETLRYCNSYYLLWRAGKDGHQICDTLFQEGLDRRDFARMQPEFLHYCRLQETNRFRALMPENKYTHLPLTQNRRTEFLEHIASGLDVAETCLLMGVPIPTLFDVWYKEDEIFKSLVTYQSRLQNAAVKKALFRRAVGHWYIKKTISKQKGTGVEGQKVNMTQTTYTETVVEPDVNAIKFFLINRLPDEFSEGGRPEAGSSRGAILDAVDADIDRGAEVYSAEQAALSAPVPSEDEPDGQVLP